MIIHIVKREGHEEHYDSRKVYASAYRACMNAHLSEKKSEQIAEQVQSAIDEWIDRQEEGVSSKRIFQRITEELKKHDTDAAFLYETHKDVN